MNLGIAALVTLASLVTGYIVSHTRYTTSKKAASDKAKLIIGRAHREAKELTDEADEKKAKLARRLKDTEENMKQRIETIQKRLQLLEKQENKWDQRLNQLVKTKDDTSAALTDAEKQANELLTKQVDELVTKAGKEREQVLDELERKYIAEFQQDYEKFLQKSEYFANEEAVKKAKSLLQGTMNRYTEPSSVDRLENTVTLKENKAIGRLIGKEGRNINYFEEKAQVAIIFNDYNANQVTVSCFHLLRREIAKRAIEKLSYKNSINEEVIDRALESSRKEMDEELEKLGRWAAKIIELPKDKWDPELLRLIGRLKYRTSYGQNILYHSLEIGFFCAMMASEIGADVETARLSGFFHDLGKAIDQDEGVDKPHDHISKDLLEKFGFSWEIVHAAWVHHDAEPAETVEAVLVKAADAISAGRPGARAESSEQYYERIAALEEMAMQRQAADKVIVMSAGREVRLYVKPDKIQDKQMQEVADGLAHEIEENLAYPGKIKVNLVRQLKAVDHAGGKPK